MKPLIENWSRHFLLYELLLAFVVGILAYSLFHLSDWIAFDALLLNKRSDLYSISASIFGVLLGFTITTMSIIAGIVFGERFKNLRSDPAYPTIWGTFLSAIKVYGLGVITSIAGLLVDSDDSPERIVATLFIFIIVLAIFRTLRIIWILKWIVSIRSLPSPE